VEDRDVNENVAEVGRSGDKYRTEVKKSVSNEI
jgi:hypothetical protein